LLQRYVRSKFKVGPKKRYLPPARGDKCPGEFFQIAVICDVSKFGRDPFSDLQVGIEKKGKNHSGKI